MSRYDEVSRLSVAEMLEDSARAVPGKEALVSGSTRMTYRELNERVTAFAASLQNLGVRKGDRIAIYMKNSAELAIGFYGSQKIGAIVAWANPNYREVELGFILQNSGAKGLILFAESAGFDGLAMLEKLRPSVPELKHVIAVGAKGRPGVLDFDQFVAGGARLKLDLPAINIHEDLSMLIYTSGTTGVPKGAMITHYQVVRGGYGYSTGIHAGSEDVFIGFLPNTHSYGCGSILIQPFLLKAKVVFMDAFKTEDAFALMEREGVTLQLASPTHYIMELDHPALKRHDLSRLRAGLLAGMICPEGLITRVQEDMKVYLTSFWGASEVGPGLGTMCPDGSPVSVREKSIGLPIEGTEVKIAGPEGEALGCGETGEMLVRGWHVLKGYWGNPEESRKQIEPDGWLHTGDMACRDDKGFLYIYGRTKDLINRGGFKIYPFELEAEICKHPKVGQVCVVPTKNPVLGENICACVIPKAANIPTLREIREFLKDQVAGHKLPDELAIFSEFPRLSGGVKIKKFGPGGLADLAEKDAVREKVRK
jgi:fatty-acyl-CoA synthase